MLRSPQLRKPRIYLAGKVRKNCWRHDLVPALRGWNRDEGPLSSQDFVYVGPIFQSCDHGCRHRPRSHGLAKKGCDGIEITRHEVFENNQAALCFADLVIAFVDATDAYGTIAEIVWAAASKIPVYLFFGHGIEPDEFWYVSQFAEPWPGCSVITRDRLPEILSWVISNWRSRG